MTADSENGSATAIGLQLTRDGVFRAAVQMAGERIGAKAFAAVRDGDDLRVTHTWRIRDPRFYDIVVRPGLGLGGLVAVSHKPNVSLDYPEDPRITKDYVATVSESEGLLSVGCVPVMGIGRVEALLYVAHERLGALSDRQIAEVQRLAAYAEIGLRQAAVRAQDLEYRRLRERNEVGTRLRHSVAETFEQIVQLAGQLDSVDDPEGLASALRIIESSASSAARELRKTLHDLTRCPPNLTFEARLASDLRAMERAGGCTIRTLRYGSSRPLGEAAALLALDVVVKVITKVIEHAAPPLILTALDYQAADFVLELWPLDLSVDEILDPAIEQLRRDAEQLGGRLAFSTSSTRPGAVILELPA